MENKTANLIEWTVQDVGREIKKKFNEDIAKKFEEQKIDGQALVFLSKEGSVAQLDLCGLNTIGDQMRLKELVSFHSETVPVVDINAGRRNNKPSVMNIKQCSEMNQRIYKAKRNAIRVAVIEVWPGNNIPTFKNNKEAEQKLNNLVKDLEKECTFEPLNFGKEGIRQHVLDVLNERRRHVRKGRDYSLPDKRTLKRKVTNPKSKTGTSSASNGDKSSNSSSDQSGDTLQVSSSEEDDIAPRVVTSPKRRIHDTDIESDSENDEPPITPGNEDINSVPDGVSVEEEAVAGRGVLANSTAQIIICVAFNAIRVSDVPRNLLQSSAKVLGIKNIAKKDKSYLLNIVAKGLLDQGYIKIRDNNQISPTRDDIIKIKPF